MDNIRKSIDLRGVRCPINFVKVKLALETIGGGEILEALLDEGEAMLNVPRSLKDEGHHIIRVSPNGDSAFTVLIKKGEA